jgi:hypothetical protein
MKRPNVQFEPLNRLADRNEALPLPRASPRTQFARTLIPPPLDRNLSSGPPPFAVPTS